MRYEVHIHSRYSGLSSTEHHVLVFSDKEEVLKFLKTPITNDYTHYITYERSYVMQLRQLSTEELK